MLLKLKGISHSCISQQQQDQQDNPCNQFDRVSRCEKARNCSSYELGKLKVRNRNEKKAEGAKAFDRAKILTRPNLVQYQPPRSCAIPLGYTAFSEMPS